MVIDKSRYIQREVDMRRYLRVSSFSSGVRQLAILKGDRVVREVLVLGENLRDSDLVLLCIALEQEGGSCFNSD